MKSPELTETLKARGLKSSELSPEEVAESVKAEVEKWISGGVGSEALLLLNETLGIKTEFVHHKSGADVRTDLGGGSIDVRSGVLFEANTGNTKPIVVMSEKPSAALPDVPSGVEAGFLAAQANNWFGVFAPAGTPKDVVSKINKDIVAVMKSADAAGFLKAQALQPSEENPEQFEERVNGEIERWTALAEKNALRL